MSNGKAESQALMNEALDFAESLLAMNGEFFPFGRAITQDGQIVSVAAYDGREMPPSDAVIELLEFGLRQGASEGSYDATALAYDCKIVPPGSSEKVDAVAIELEHRQGFAATVLFTYRLNDEQVEVIDSFATAASRGIFQ